MPSDAPPSYDSVVQDLHAKAGPNPTPEALLQAADALPPYEKKVLVENISTDHALNLTDDEKKALALGMAKTMSSEEGVKAITQSASIVTTNIRALDTMFAHLTQELSSIDGQYVSPADGPFAPRLATFVTVSFTFMAIGSSFRRYLTSDCRNTKILFVRAELWQELLRHMLSVRQPCTHL